MNRRRSNSLAGNPLLIGAITTLIVVVAVFLAYNANNGLPFVPTYNINVELPEASGLQPSNQVRIARHPRGHRQRADAASRTRRTGRVTAIAELKLEKNVEPLPADTHGGRPVGLGDRAEVPGTRKGNLARRSSSRAGRSRVAQTREPVEHRTNSSTCSTRPTRTAIKINTNNFGDGLAGRGLGLNNTIARTAPARHARDAGPAQPRVAATRSCAGCSSRSTAASSQAAPVAETQADLVRRPRHVLHRLRGRPKSLEEATVGGPPSLEQAIYSLPTRRSSSKTRRSSCACCARAQRILVTVAPAARRTRSPTGAINLDAAHGARTTARRIGARRSQEFAQNPIVHARLRRLHRRRSKSATRCSRGSRPTQAKCNYWTLAFRNLASLQLGEHRRRHARARGLHARRRPGPNNEGFPSSAPANGPSTEHAAKQTARSSTTTTCTSTPTRTSPRPGQPQVLRSGQRELRSRAKR